MVKRTKQNIAGQIEKLDEKEINNVASYISQLLSARIAKQSEPQSNDDLIVFLSNKHENQRARQVFEWEKARRQQSTQRAV